MLVWFCTFVCVGPVTVVLTACGYAADHEGTRPSFAKHAPVGPAVETATQAIYGVSIIVVASDCADPK